MAKVRVGINGFGRIGRQALKGLMRRHPGEVEVVGVDRGGAGFIPKDDSTFQQGDVMDVVVARESMDKLDTQLEPVGDH